MCQSTDILTARQDKASFRTLLFKLSCVAFACSMKDMKEYHTFFHALTFAGSRGSCLNTRLQGGVFKLLPKDPANVNAL